MIILIVAGCGGPSVIVMAPKYKKQSISDAALGIIIQDRSPLVRYNGCVQSVFGIGDTQELVMNFFKRQLLEDLLTEANFKTAFYSSADERYLVSNEMVIAQEGNVIIELPAPGTHFKFNTTDADIVLCIQEMRIGTETDDYHVSRAEEGLNTRPSRKLLYNTSFVLWDNRSRQYISYGRVKNLVPILTHEALLSDWNSISKQYVRTIFGPAGLLRE